MKKNLKHIARLAAVAGLGASIALGAVPVVATADELNGAVTEDGVVDSESKSNETFTGSENPAANQENAEVVAQADATVSVEGIDTFVEFKQAFSDAPDGVQTTIVLTGDIVCQMDEIATIPAGKSIILDMGGHKITCVENYVGRPIVNEGTLVLTGNGEIDTSMSPSGGYGAINNKGTLTVENGVFRGAIYASGSCIRNTGANAVLTVNNGTFEGATAAIYNEGSAVLNDGKYIGETCSSCNSIWGYTVRNQSEESKMTINGGYYEGVQGAVSAAIGELIVNDGHFKTVKCKKTPAHNATFYALYAAGEAGKVYCEIHGGTFETEGGRSAAVIGNDNKGGDGGINADAAARVFGGTFKTNGSEPALKVAEETGTSVIFGGTFLSSNAPSNIDDKYLAPGMKVDDTGAVVVDQAANPIAIMTQGNYTIGAFTSVSDAAKNAPENATITLVADVTEDVVIPSTVSVTLDLAGHKITNKANHTITNNGTLVVSDSVGGGEVDNITHGKAALSMAEGSKATLNGGTFKRSKEAGTLASNAANGNSYYTIINKGDLTIDDGAVIELLLADGSPAGFSSVIDNGWFSGKPSTDGYNAKLTIKGGVVRGGKYVKNDSFGTLFITGGEIVDGAEASVLNWNNASISGGSFDPADTAKGVVYTLKIKDSTAEVGKVEVTGGEFKTTGQQKPVYTDASGSNQATDMKVSGGTFTGNPPSEDYIVPGSGLTQNPDGTFGVHNHVGKKVDAVAATCTTPGMKEHWSCTDCDKLFSDANLKNEVAKADLEIAATGHDATTAKRHKRVEPTYEADGNIEYWECAACGTLFSDAKLTKEIAQADTVLPKLVPHKVTFVNAFADDVVVEVKDGESVARPADPTHEGWEFMGWYITLNDDGTLKDEYDFATPVEGDLLLYAGWVKKDVTEPQQPVADNTAKPGSTLPKTGDASMLPMIAAAGAGVSAIALGAVARRRQK